MDGVLLKDDAPLRVQADSQKTCKHFFAPSCQLSGVLLDGDGMQVRDGKKEGVIGMRVLLQRDPLSQCTKVVAQMGHACGLDARKNSLPAGEVVRVLANVTGTRTEECRR